MNSLRSRSKSSLKQFALLLAAVVSLVALRPALADQPLPAKIRVLFIGNSYTYTQDIPGLIVDLFAAKGVFFERESDTPGGSSLSDHWSDGYALAAIRRGGWDYVVLQDQSSRPLNDRSGLIASVAQFDTEIRKVGARTLVYQTWPLQSSFTGTAPNQTSSDGVYINESYRQAAAGVGAILVPVGTAWPAAANANGLATMYADGSHPLPAGAYLSAITFYRTLSRMVTAGMPKPSSVTQAQANNDQAAADAVALAPTVAPTFNLASGSYAGAQRIMLNTVTPQATIYYTLDGTTPTTSSAWSADGGVVLISRTTTLKALAAGAVTASSVTSATYTLTTTNGQTLFGSGNVSNLAVSWPGNPANLAGTNAGFESGAASPWGFYGSGGPVNGTFVHTGAYAAQLATGGMQRYVNGLSTSTLYEASIWYRYGTNVASTNFTAQAFSNPSVQATAVLPNRDMPLTWRRASQRFTTDASATSVQLVCQRNTDTGSYDDLEFYKVPEGYELGTRLRTAVAGKISALRAWRPPGGPTAYTLRLWDSTGAVLEQVTVSGLSATGWFEGTLATPRSVTANTTYTVSYGVAEGGFYQSAANGLAAAVGTEVISSLAMGGVYSLARNTFPSVSTTTSYSADVRFVAISKQAWRSDYFSPAELGNPALEATLWGDQADPDQDGVPNLVEYALERSPLAAMTPAAGLTPTGAPLSLTFTRARPDVTYLVEGSDDLVTWNTVAQNPGSLGQSVTVNDSAPAPASRRFLRLKIIAP